MLKLTNTELTTYVLAAVRTNASHGIATSAFMLLDALDALNVKCSRGRITRSLRTLVAGGLIAPVTMYHYSVPAETKSTA